MSESAQCYTYLDYIYIAIYYLNIKFLPVCSDAMTMYGPDNGSKHDKV